MKVLKILFCIIIFSISQSFYAQSLAGLDTVIVDTKDSVFNFIPNGYKPIDTITVKNDSSNYWISRVGENGNFYSEHYNLNNNHSKYYVIFKITVPPFNNSGHIWIDTNNSNYISIYLYGQINIPTFFSDTLIMDSSSSITVSYISDKSAFTMIETRSFHITTKIVIDRFIGLNDEMSSSPKIELYPNPFQEKIFLSGDMNLNRFEYFIYSAKGEEVLNGFIHENKIEINILPKGIYFIQIPELNFSKQIIKQ